FSLVEPLADYAPVDSLASESEYRSPIDDLPFESEERDDAQPFSDREQRFNQAASERREQEPVAPMFQLDVLRALDLLNVRREIKAVIERAFPDKCAAAIVPDIEAALQLSIESPSVIYVTYEGEQ